MTDETPVDWHDWGEAAFAAARERDVPVLLSLTATWCADCHEMDASTYAEPRIAANVNDGFLPVRVDVDRHPRVRERYNMGGFPSTVFLTPEGKLITGATYLEADGMRQVLDRVRDRWDESGDDAGRVPRALAGNATPAGEVTDRIEAHLAGQLDEKFDHQFAGWGDRTKFPLPRTVEFALKRAVEQATDTLDAISRNLEDDVEGGFFRYAGGRDWSDPHHAKRLDANAALLRAFANGYLYTGRDEYRATARHALDFLVDALWTGSGFGGSQGAAASRDYYELDAEGRADAATPRRDFTVFAGANAAVADALLVLTAYTDDERAREYATRTLEAVEGLVDDGVVTHHRAGDAEGERGLLADQARVAGAFARAAQVLGDDAGDYTETARTVADHALDTLLDEDSFLDGPSTGAGLLGYPFRPLDGNVEMAEALLDLSALTGEDAYREVATDAVGAFAGAWDRIGVQVAGYGSVAARCCRPDLVVDVDAPGTDLHRAALRVADHEKVVRPGHAESGTAVVRVGAERVTATTPDELMQGVASVTDDR